MNIDGIHLYSAATELTSAVKFAELSLNQADLSESYILHSAFGLDIDSIIPQFYGGYLTDQYFNMSLKPREITLKVRLNPQLDNNETPSTLRDALYKLIGVSRTGLSEIRLMNGATHVAFIRGFISKFEASLFDRDTDVQITFNCPYPIFRGPSYIELAGTGGVTVPSPTLVDNASTAPHGFKMQLTFTGSVATSFTIQGTYSTTIAPFKLLRASGDPFPSGYSIWLSSEQDNRYVLGGTGTGVPIADTIDANQIWPIMFPGSTQIGFSSSLVTINSITYRPHYWGV
jgi:hypothetical protein